MNKTNTAASRQSLAKRAVAIAVCAALTLTSGLAAPASAHAASLKSGSISKITTQAANARKGYTISSGNTVVYSNTGLTKKYGTIFGSDEVTVITVTGSYTKVTYPTSRGSKTGYVKTGALLTKTTGTTYKSSGKFTTYRHPGGSVYGSVAKGDSVLVLGTNGNYTQIKYPVSGGYKYAFTPTANVNSYLKGASSSLSPAPSNSVQARLNQIANGTLRYNSSTVMAVGKKFTGTRASEQCKGYAKNVFYLCFKVTPNSTQPKPNNHLLYGTSGMTRVGYYSSMTSTRAKSLFSKARPGDFIQMRRTHGGSHSMIVYSVQSTGITVLQANLDGRNTVSKNTYTWAQLANANKGMSLYTATNYKLR